MSFDYGQYIRMEKMPFLWCPGCGIGIVAKALYKAFSELGWKNEDIAMVSGIGCTSRITGYTKANTLHTTHGRALSFATGIKMVRPDKHVVSMAGDGDTLAIGGNHFIHACRRNIDITVIIVNNHIYGMTGGQFSPTTPQGAYAATAPYGNIEPGFDVAELAKASGATYVARCTVANGVMMERLIRNGLAHHGFSVIEVIANCHTQFGRRNRMPDAWQMIDDIKDRTVALQKAEKMSPEELVGKFVVGELYKANRPEYTDEYERLRERALAKQAAKKGA
ncbi:MAG: 2-oxoglutarate ferredoxin oxidoreductase subunit beta [bacterium]|nr:2-oxoglutarate ferredoxin oxidoreductase subunit beta [bacterium]